jgi:tRNA threonylcarbamoyladenosine biosynthesis protein TsaE
MYEVTVQNESETLNVAAQFGRILGGKGVVYLNGELGAGKTTFCRGILRTYGYDGAVKSPTFTLVEPYDLQWGQVFHFDLYRIADPEELEFLGIEDYLEGGNLCLIEWSERGTGFLPNADIVLDIKVAKQARHLTFTACSEFGRATLQQMGDSSKS